MNARIVTFFVICGFITIRAAYGEEINIETLKTLNDDSFQNREEATKKLIAADISIETIQKLISQADEPEVRHRLNLVIQGKMEIIGWAVLTNEEMIKRAKPCGKERDGRNLYLARIHHNGEDVIGKYNFEWVGGNFPVGQSELQLPNFQVWIGKGTWEKWDTASSKMIPMGRKKDGRIIYAARATLNGGVHPGTLIAGETKARISWGGEVVFSDIFEVLEMD
jgi:hypothetical protein